MNEVICVALVVVIIVLLYLIKRQDRKYKEAIALRLEKEPTRQLACVEIVIDDLLYLGKESEIVKTKVDVQLACVYQFECLCKTNAGNWFVLTFELNTRIKAPAWPGQVHPIGEKDAKAQLSQHIAEYKKHFGEVKTA